MKRKVLLFSMVALSALVTVRTEAQNIYTFAGIGGTTGYSGDDSISTIARLSGPSGIVTNASGVYFSDSRNNVVRKVNIAGIITTFAGTGTGGYAGDGGPASAARLRGSNGVATDAIGNIYIADTRNNVVRKVDTFGIISTVAGNNTVGYSGDGGDATAAQLRAPAGVAVDAAGNLYISDTRNHVIREVNTSGIISTIAGNNTPGYTGDLGPATAAQLNLPMGIAITSSGKLYIADNHNDVVRMVNTSGVISTKAGNGMIGYSGDGGLATNAQLNRPNDVKVDAAGNVFICDSNHTVRIVNTGDTIKAFAGTHVAGYTGDGGAATAAKMTAPDGLAIDAAHNIYISTQGNNVIRRVGAPIAGIHITSNVGDTACIGHATSFIATPIADATPHYQWLQNGTLVGTDVNTYTPAAMVTGDIIACKLLSAGGAEIAVSNNIRVDSMGRTGTITGTPTYCVGSNANVRDLGGPPPGTGIWVSSNTTVATITPPSRVTALTAGTTIIYFIVNNACGSDTASFPITVIDNPIGVISGPSVVCTGATATYTDTTTGGLWRVRPIPAGIIDSSTGVFTAGFMPGPAYILYAISPACYRIDSITIDSTPVNAAISGPSVVDSSLTITLSNPNPGGVWSSSNPTVATVDATTGVVTGMSSGTVTITYTLTGAGGCTADTTYQVTVINTTGVTNKLLSAAYMVYPNPTNGSLNIDLGSQVAGNTKMVIADVAGRTVFAADVTVKSGKTAHFDVTSLQPGLYILTIKSDAGVYTSKLEVAK